MIRRYIEPFKTNHYDGYEAHFVLDDTTGTDMIKWLTDVYNALKSDITTMSNIVNMYHMFDDCKKFIEKQIDLDLDIIGNVLPHYADVSDDGSTLEIIRLPDGKTPAMTLKY